MGIKAIGMHETDRHRRHASSTKLRGRGAHGILIQWLKLFPICGKAASDLQPQPAVDQWRGAMDRVIIQVRTLLTSDLKHITKPARGQQPGWRSLALDDHIGGHGGAMAEIADRFWVKPGLDHLFQPVLDRLGRIMRGRRRLEMMRHTGGFIDQREIRERPTNIHANAQRIFHLPTRLVFSVNG